MQNRQRGEGAVYRRRDGRWEGQLRLPDGRGKSIYASTRRRAVSKLVDAGWRAAHGLPLHATRRTVADHLIYWLEVTRRRVRPTTLEAYELTARRLVPLLGSMRLERVGPSVIQATYDSLLAGGLSPRSVGQTHVVLHRTLYQAVH